MRLLSLLLLLCLLSACGTQPQTPPVTRVSPSPGDSSEFTTIPAGLPGLLFKPGLTFNFKVPEGQHGLLLVVNPSSSESNFDIGVEPAGEPEPSPSPSPSADHGPPPFGFGFGDYPAPMDAAPFAPVADPVASPPAEAAPSAEAAPPVELTPLPDVSPSPADTPPNPAGTVVSGPTIPVDERLPLSHSRRLQALAPLSVGQEQSFWINNGDTTLAGDRLRSCQLRLVTPHAYFFVDDESVAAVSAASLRLLGDAYETQIRPTLTAVSGSEETPGIDGDAHLYIVVSPWLGKAEGRAGMMGYFWPRDPVQRGGTGTDLRQHANEKEVLFLATPILDQPAVTCYGTLAHEYQHLLTFCDKTRAAGTTRTEETWLDEGLSMYAMDLAGFGLQGGDQYVAQEISAYQQDPSAYSLTDWNGNPNGYSYGLSYLFVRYLADRFGQDLIKEVLDNPTTGVKGLQAVLKRHNQDFAQVFLDWAQAVHPPEAPSVKSAYDWFDPEGTFGGVKLPGSQPLSLVQPRPLKLRPWSLAYLETDGWPVIGRVLSLKHASAPVMVLDAQKGGAP